MDYYEYREVVEKVSGLGSVSTLKRWRKLIEEQTETKFEVSTKRIGRISTAKVYVFSEEDISKIQQVANLKDRLGLRKARLKESIIENDVEREGKPTKYRLGSLIVIDDEYVLTAFSKFNKDNDAQLTVNDYLDFLIQFWNRINSIYAQKKVVVPIFGSGITRFKNGMGDINENELLRIMIWTFKVSKIKFEYPADLSIIIHPDKIDKIDIFSLKEEEE